MKVWTIPFLLLLLLLGCTRSSKDPKEVAKFFLGEVPQSIELVRAEFRYVRHPDAPRYGFIDMRMDERDYAAIVRDHGMSAVNPSRLVSAKWPKDLAPVQLTNAKVFANPLIVMICESGSNRVVVLSVAQFPGWYGKP
jgi:hypothetical protein